jgi:hypothetical protein
VEKREQPSWTPYAYIGAGIVGFLVTGLAFFVGQFGFFDAIIVGLSLGAIIVGIKQLRDRRTNPESQK